MLNAMPYLPNNNNNNVAIFWLSNGSPTQTNAKFWHLACAFGTVLLEMLLVP